MFSSLEPIAVSYLIAVFLQSPAVFVLFGSSLLWLFSFGRPKEAKAIAGVSAIVVASTGTLILAAYWLEVAIAYGSGNDFDRYGFENRIRGPYWWVYWFPFVVTAVLPICLWIPRIRRSPAILVAFSALIGIGLLIVHISSSLQSVFNSVFESSP